MRSNISKALQDWFEHFSCQWLWFPSCPRKSPWNIDFYTTYWNTYFISGNSFLISTDECRQTLYGLLKFKGFPLLHTLNFHTCVARWGLSDANWISGSHLPWGTLPQKEFCDMGFEGVFRFQIRFWDYTDFTYLQHFFPHRSLNDPCSPHTMGKMKWKLNLVIFAFQKYYEFE